MRSLFGLAALLALPALLLADLAWAVHLGWWTSGPVVMAAAALVGSGMLLLFIRRSRRWLADYASRLGLACGAILLALLGAEFVLHSFVPMAEFHLRRPHSQYRFAPSPWALPGVSQEATMTINSRGVRGSEFPKSPSAYRILCVGGGTTECLYLDDTETWPAQVEQSLNGNLSRDVWVGAAGRSGYASSEHADFMKQTPLLEEVDCAIVLLGADDLLQRLFAISSARPWLTKSRLLRITALAMDRQVRAGMRADLSGEQLSKARRTFYLRQQPLDVDQALADFETQVRDMMRVAKERQLRIVFVTTPVLWDDQLNERARQVLRYARFLEEPNPDDLLQPPRCREMMDRFHARLLATCRESKCEIIDASFLSSLDRFFSDDIHLNEAGCRELARVITDHLMREGIPPG